MAEYATDWWTISLLPDWVPLDDPECSIFERHGGDGALTISAAQKDGFVTGEDLREFASDHLSAGANTRDLKIGDFDGFVFRYRDDENYWRQWFVKCGATLLFVTYNCPVDSAEEEDEAVDRMLSTLRTRQFAL